jgi:hypothetical protein
MRGGPVVGPSRAAAATVLGLAGMAGPPGDDAGARPMLPPSRGNGEQWIFVTFRFLQLDTIFLSRDRERQLTAQRRQFLEMRVFAELENGRVDIGQRGRFAMPAKPARGMPGALAR